MRTYKAKQMLVVVVGVCVLYSSMMIMVNAMDEEEKEVEVDVEDDNLKSCYLQNPQFDCPPNSLCMRINATNHEDLKCICLQNYQLNAKWDEDLDNATATLENNYCIPSAETEHKVIVYLRSTSNPQHLVFGIVMILLGVTLVTAVLYGLKVLRPIKRTKAAYKRITNRRQNITPLHEMDELEMNRRFEMQTF